MLTCRLFDNVLSPLFFLVCLFLPPAVRGEDRPNPIRIGVVQSLFRDVPDAMVGVAMKPFSLLMKAQTGVDSELAPPTDTEHLADLLAKDKVQFALFEGVEFAWARRKYPEFRTLVICVNEHQNRQAFLMVRQDSKISRFADLQGKELAIPRRSRTHCHLFVERLARECGKEPKEFFSKLIISSNVEAALDDLADGKLPAVVADREALNCYQHRKPGRFAKLKELQKSEIFPDTVVAYRPGVFDQALLNRFREGLEKADSTSIGRQLLVLWQMTALQKIPADYEKLLADIVKAYPPPWESTSKAVPARQ
jgi:ABC-type phosphate/phosphonate transport system substrate-binding protein